MGGGINLELIVGLVIGWYISENFLKGPVSQIASQVLGALPSGGGGATSGRAAGGSGGYTRGG